MLRLAEEEAAEVRDNAKRDAAEMREQAARDAKAMRAEAYRDRDSWPPELLGATAIEAQRFFHYDENIRAELLMAALKPTPTKDEAKAIGETLGLKPFMEILNAAFGMEDEGKADPKAEPPAAISPESTGASTTGE